MARARNIKPGFFANELLSEIPFEFRLLFIGLWTYADRAGRFEYRPKKIKAAIFPYDDDVDIEGGIVALAQRGFLIPYTVESVSCCQIENWLKHQHPHVNEKQSEIPPPSEGTILAPCKNGACTRAIRLIPDSLIPDSLIQVSQSDCEVEVLDSWKTVADRLAAIGVDDWNAAIEAAIKHGCTPTYATQVIDYGIAHDFGAGAVFLRLKKSRSTMPVDTGWPGSSRQQKKRKAAAADRENKKLDEAKKSLAMTIVRKGNHAGKSDEEIDRELASRGLERP